MKMFYVLLFVFSLVSSIFAQEPCSPSKHAKLPAITNFTYHKARPILLKAGWQPFQTIHHNEAPRSVNIEYGNGPLFWSRGYFELANCSGTGLAHCVFLFKDAYGNTLQITTHGEEGKGPGKRYYYARISSYRFICE